MSGITRLGIENGNFHAKWHGCQAFAPNEIPNFGMPCTSSRRFRLTGHQKLLFTP
jgi:hypothetical protein